MREIVYDQLQERVYTGTLDNGLQVVVVPKADYQQAYATFSTDFGSIDNRFVVPATGVEMRVPDGIAHFLEHKMFEAEDEDVFQKFAAHAASANAFTTFDMTTYLFSSTSDIMTNLETLIDFVQDPYFTDENVEKEKGIIGQEIHMYEDNPDWRSFFDLLKGLFHIHPVSIDIAGTVESIAEITKDTLYTCYRTFYHPSNMVLSIVGSVDPNEVWDVVVKNQSKKNFTRQAAVQRIFDQEPGTIHKSRVELQLPVSSPRCLMGFKDRVSGLRGKELLTRELLTALCLDGLFGKSSKLHNQLFEEGIIDQRFSWEYEITPHYGFSIIGGNTKDPERLLSIVAEEIEKAKRSGIDESVFERSRKKAIGRFMSSLDSPRYIARNVVSYQFKGADLFDTMPILESLTLDEANRRLRDHLDLTQQSVSIVWTQK